MQVQKVSVADHHPSGQRNLILTPTFWHLHRICRNWASAVALLQDTLASLFRASRLSQHVQSIRLDCRGRHAPPSRHQPSAGVGHRGYCPPPQPDRHLCCSRPWTDPALVPSPNERPARASVNVSSTRALVAHARQRPGRIRPCKKRHPTPGSLRTVSTPLKLLVRQYLLHRVRRRIWRIESQKHHRSADNHQSRGNDDQKNTDHRLFHRLRPAWPAQWALC